MRGSSTFATRQASLSTLLGPPGLYKNSSGHERCVYSKIEVDKESRHMKMESLGGDIYLRALWGEGFFKICQDLSPQLTLCRLYSREVKMVIEQLTVISVHFAEITAF